MVPIILSVKEDHKFYISQMNRFLNILRIFELYFDFKL